MGNAKAKEENKDVEVEENLVEGGAKRRKLKSGLKEHDFYCVKCRDHRRHTRSEKNYCHQKYEITTKTGIVRTTYRLLSFCKVCKYKVGKFVNFETASKYPECPKV